MTSTTPSNGLSVRASRCLAKAGIPWERDVIVRLLRTGLSREDLAGKSLRALVEALLLEIPSGVGSSRADLVPSEPELREILLGP